MKFEKGAPRSALSPSARRHKELASRTLGGKMKLALEIKVYSKAFWLDRNGGVAALFGVGGLAVLVLAGGATAFDHGQTARAHTTSIKTAPVGGIDRVAGTTDGTEISAHSMAAGKNVGANIELSLMLDVTGSMAGDKIAALKSAAKDFVKRLVWDDQSTFKSRIALVPFSSSVRLPRSAQAIATGPRQATKIKTVSKWHWYNGWHSVNQTYYKTNCLAERTGPNAYTDAPPGEGDFVMSVYAREASTTCDTGASNVIVPLTNDTSVLKSAIESLNATGKAAGQLGAAWAWYTLSPNWNRLWRSHDNQAAAYGVTNTKKIAILLSGGDNTTQYAADGTVSSRGDAANGSSTNQIGAMCTAMKASGVTVYTIGFDVASESTASNTLSHCATDGAKVFTSNNGEDLQQAFRTIAQEIIASNLSS